MKSKFLRVRKSENLNPRKTSVLKDAIQKNKFIYIDFDDENMMKMLDQSAPENSEEMTELIGDNHIAGIDELSFKTKQMLNYLSSNKILNEQRKHIDQVVRTRIRREKERLHNQQQLERKKRKRVFSRKYELENNDFRNSLDLPEIEDYLEERESQKMLHKLSKGEGQLTGSISKANSYLPLKSLKLKERGGLILPKLRYNQTKA